MLELYRIQGFNFQLDLGKAWMVGIQSNECQLAREREEKWRLETGETLCGQRKPRLRTWSDRSELMEAFVFQ